jgi:hypothetical protein
MKRATAAKTLRSFNAWRRGAEIPMPPAADIGKAIDAAIKALGKPSPSRKGLPRMRKALSGMVGSYEILINDSPLAKNDIARGVIRGAFIIAIDEARACLLNAQENRACAQEEQK